MIVAVRVSVVHVCAMHTNMIALGVDMSMHTTELQCQQTDTRKQGQRSRNSIHLYQPIRPGTPSEALQKISYQRRCISRYKD